MKVSRREFSRNCALAASAAALGDSVRVWAQVQGEHIKETSAHPVRSIQDTETPAEKNERMKWFREARFGMFIHWGLYAIPAGRWDGKEIPGIGEWIMNRATIPVAQYKALASKFNLANEAERNSLMEKARAVIYKLPTEQRKTLEMAFFDGLTHSEIAEMTGEPLGTVKTRIRSALTTLRKAFQA